MDYLLLGLCGVALVFLGRYLKKRDLDSKGNYTEMVEATVLSFTQCGPFEQGEVTYYPVLEYSYKGKKYTTDGKEGVANDMEVGTTFTIFLNPDKPEDFCLVKGGETFPSLVAKVFGYFFICSAILLQILD